MSLLLLSQVTRDFCQWKRRKIKKSEKIFFLKYFTHIKRRVLYRSAVLRFGKIAACRQMRNLAHLAAVENLLSARFQLSAVMPPAFYC